MKSKGKRVPAEASPPPPFPVAGDAVARMKHRILLQDYQELLKDIEAKRIRLQKAKDTKPRLFAEVRFLRKKHQQFTEAPLHQATTYRLKKQPRKAPSPPSRLFPAAEEPERSWRSAVPLRSGDYGVTEAGKAKTSVMLDLNEAFMPNGEEMEEFESESAAMEKQPKRCLSEAGGVMGRDQKRWAYRGARGEAAAAASWAGKRRITWQDQVAF